VASTTSRRKALPGTTTRIGGFCLSITRTCMGEVWQRSRKSSLK
jgi:hypothetical protein